MPSPNSISSDKLFRLIGTPHAPIIVDVRDDAVGLTHLLAGAIPDAAFGAAQRAALAGRAVVTVCADGGARSHGRAALLRSEGIAAEALDGGADAWRVRDLPVVPTSKLPRRNANGQTVWVTRARPKVDRIACPWLIRRFVDPFAQFLFVPSSAVAQVSEQTGGAAFDIEGSDVFWTHRGELCTFDIMVDEFGLSGIPALGRLAMLVRGADTARPELAPEAAGLLAVSLGLARMYSDDLEQLAAGMLIYDAFYRWARDATLETHTWVQHQARGVRT